MNSKFPYCDQTDCKHYDNCQDNKSILVKVLKQTELSVEMHNRCRNMHEQLWKKHLLIMLQKTAE